MMSRLLVSQLCYTYTTSEYERISTTFGGICERNGIRNWWNWWDCRKYHIVPAYRGFNLSGVNLAESGHSTMRVQYKMSLAVAAWKDMCHQIIQDRDYIAFVENTHKVTGKGLNLMQRIERKKKTDKNFVTSALEALQTGDLEAEAIIHLDEDMGFIPSNSTRHRVPLIYPLSNQMQKCRHNSKNSFQV